MDSLIGIAGLALGIGQSTVAVSSERRRTFYISTLIIFAFLAIYWGWLKFDEHERVSGIESDVIQILGLNEPKTFDQLAEKLNENRNKNDPIAPKDLDAAIEIGKSKGVMCSAKVTAVGPGAREYDVLVYSERGLKNSIC